MSLAPAHSEQRAKYVATRQRAEAKRARLLQAEQRKRQEVAEARALGVAVVVKTTIDTRWTEQEDEVLRKLYPDYTRIGERLPHRAGTAIKARCKFIGIQGNNPNKVSWTSAEIQILKRVYPNLSKAEVMAALPRHASWSKITGQASACRLYRPRQELKPTGHPIMDQVRIRAVQRKISMPDLDGMAETGSYFCRRPWNGASGVSMNKLARAVEALGGRLVVQWED